MPHPDRASLELAGCILSLEEDLHSLHRECAADVVSIAFRDDQGLYTVFPCCLDGVPFGEASPPMKKMGPCDIAWTTGRPILVTDNEGLAEGQGSAFARAEHLRGLMIVPVTDAMGNTTALLSILTAEPRYWSDGERLAAETTSRRIATRFAGPRGAGGGRLH